MRGIIVVGLAALAVGTASAVSSLPAKAQSGFPGVSVHSSLHHDLCKALQSPQLQQSCFAEEAYQSDWRSFEADNGAVTAIDINSISRIRSPVAHDARGQAIVTAAFAQLCSIENNRCANETGPWAFDCERHYFGLMGGVPRALFKFVQLDVLRTYAAPRSVAGAILTFACTAPLPGDASSSEISKRQGTASRNQTDTTFRTTGPLELNPGPGQTARQPH